MLKILMLNDCAYVGYELKKELESNFDVKINHVLYHNKLGFNFSKILNLVKMFNKTIFCKYDLIHVNYLGIASYIAFLSNKPYIIHVHGSDIRNPKYNTGVKINFIKQRILKNAVNIIYATPDLKKYLPNRSIYLETPVGNQFFNFKYSSRKYDIGYRKVWYEKQDLPYDIVLKDFKYSEMPKILNNIKYFFDRYKIDTLSKTALEALKCGCFVYDSYGRLIIGFPEEHDVKNVAKKLYKIYEDSLK